MEAWSIFASIVTVVAFATFIGIVIWAYSRNRKKDFDEAANAPFALPDDGDPEADNPRRRGRPS